MRHGLTFAERRNECLSELMRDSGAKGCWLPDGSLDLSSIGAAWIQIATLQALGELLQEKL